MVNVTDIKNIYFIMKLMMKLYLMQLGSNWRIPDLINKVSIGPGTDPAELSFSNKNTCRSVGTYSQLWCESGHDGC